MHSSIKKTCLFLFLLGLFPYLLASDFVVYSIQNKEIAYGISLDKKEYDSFKYKAELTQFKASRFVLPASLIGFGAIVRHSNLDEMDKTVQKESQRNLKTNNKLDYFTLVMPYAAIYGLDWCGVKPAHNFRDRTIVTGTSVIISYSLIEITKQSSRRLRPDGSDRKSFPSGHTGLAFAGAHILMKEYRHASPWIGVAGYTAATATGVLRITNNKHWLSDVVTGAGVGILGTELSYLLLPHLSKALPFGAKTSPAESGLELKPFAAELEGEQYVGVGFQYTF